MRCIGCSRPSRLLLLVAAALSALSCGCATLPLHYASDVRRANGLVVILPGIEGRGPFNINIARGLHRGGVKSAISIYDWTTAVPFGMFRNLMNLPRNRTEARRVAAELAAYRRDYPQAPIHLIGHSGGGGVAIMALEELPDDVQIDGAFLLAPALSPRYDLTRALQRVRGKLTSYHSPRDLVILTWGTSVFGTIDRRKCIASGVSGFAPPEALDPADRQLYADKLYQVGYTADLQALGASGTHIGWTRPDFVAAAIAPEIVRVEELAAQLDSGPEAAAVPGEPVDPAVAAAPGD